MDPTRNPSQARREFAVLASQSDAEIDAQLARAALWIAAEGRPELDVEAELARIGELAEAARAAVAAAPTLRARVEELNRWLFERSGFTGNRDDYYDPRNSFLDQVLERRRGIPITLCVLYVEVARRLGLRAQGVAFPGHFLAKVSDDSHEIIVDAFHAEILSPSACEARLRSMLGPDSTLAPEMLDAAPGRSILARMLRNLKLVYLREDAFEEALACCDRILLLEPDAVDELRDRAVVLERLECYAASVRDLERFLELAPSHDSADAVRQALGPMRARAQQLH